MFFFEHIFVILIVFCSRVGQSTHKLEKIASVVNCCVIFLFSHTFQNCSQVGAISHNVDISYCKCLENNFAVVFVFCTQVGQSPHKLVIYCFGFKLLCNFLVSPDFQNCSQVGSSYQSMDIL